MPKKSVNTPFCLLPNFKDLDWRFLRYRGPFGLFLVLEKFTSLIPKANFNIKNIYFVKKIKGVLKKNLQCDY